MDRLLKLIDEGDPDVILSEEKLIPRFNELMKYDLVTLKDDKVYLTHKGREAKREGVDKFIKRQKQLHLQNTLVPNPGIKKPAIAFSGKIVNRKVWLIGLLLLLLLVLSLGYVFGMRTEL